MSSNLRCFLLRIRAEVQSPPPEAEREVWECPKILSLVYANTAPLSERPVVSSTICDPWFSMS